MAGGNPVSFVEVDGHEPATSYDRNATQPMRDKDGSCLRCDPASMAGPDPGLPDGPDPYYQRGRADGEPMPAPHAHPKGAHTGPQLQDLPYSCQSCDSPRERARGGGALRTFAACAIGEFSVGIVDLGGDKSSAACTAGQIAAMANPKGLVQGGLKRGVREGGEQFGKESGANFAAKAATWPQASNPRLQNALRDDYRGGPNPIGDGSALDAARHTVRTGDLVGGTTHLEKVVEMRDRYARILRRGGLDQADVAIARRRYDAYRDFAEEHRLEEMMQALGLR